MARMNWNRPQFRLEGKVTEAIKFEKRQQKKERRRQRREQAAAQIEAGSVQQATQQPGSFYFRAERLIVKGQPSRWIVTHDHRPPPELEALEFGDDLVMDVLGAGR